MSPFCMTMLDHAQAWGQGRQSSHLVWQLYCILLTHQIQHPQTISPMKEVLRENIKPLTTKRKLAGWRTVNRILRGCDWYMLSLEGGTLLSSETVTTLRSRDVLYREPVFFRSIIHVPHKIFPLFGLTKVNIYLPTQVGCDLWSIKWSKASFNSVFILLEWLPYQKWRTKSSSPFMNRWVGRDVDLIVKWKQQSRLGFELRSLIPFPTVITITWCNGYRHRIWTRRHEFKSWTRADCISHSTNTLGKCMNPIILPPAMGN